MKLPLCLCAAVMLMPGAAGLAWGQIAGDPLVQTGSLTLPTGAYSPLPEREVRLTALYLSETGSFQNRPLSSNPLAAQVSAEAFAADYSYRDVLYSVGYQHAQFSLADDASGRIISYAVVQDAFALEVSSRVSELLHVAARVTQISSKSTIEFSPVHGEAANSYTDFAAGYTAELTPTVRMGANYSPAVNSISRYNGDLVGVESKVGHGSQFLAGFAHHTPAASFGLDGYDELEYLPAESPHTQGTIVHGRVRFGNFAVGAQYEGYTKFELRTDSRFISPKSDNTRVSGGVWWAPGSWVLGIVAQEETNTASDTGDPAANATRFDSSTLHGILLSVVKVL